MKNVISGIELSKKIKKDIKERVNKFYKETDIIPKLIVILVGNNSASKSYIKGKQKACDEVGIQSELIHLDESTSEEELIKIIDDLNKDNSVHGILVQLPLPKHIDELKIIHKISYEKDVDGFNPINVGKLYSGLDCFVPCTPAGIIKLIKETNIDIEGKHAVVVGRSNIVGKPVAQLLLNENATVTVCHSRTKNLKEICLNADILIAAVGKPKLITKDMIKKDALVIDVGVNRLENGKLCGDVDFDNAKEVAKYITPVPGGVGPMTITMLLENTLKAAKIIGGK